MEKSSSPLDTLRQLSELLDAGTITPQEFETLKSRLLAPPASAPNHTPPVPPAPFAAEPTPPAPPYVPPVPPDLAGTGAADTSRPAFTAPDYPTFSPPTTPVPAPRPQAEPAPEPELVEEEVEELPRSPLGKILAIGGGVLLVALILYLVLGQSRPSEHLTSTSQTAADTVTVAPETGPQAEQLDLPPVVAPETVRVAPVVPVAPDSGMAAATSSSPALPETPATPVPAAAADNTDEASSRINSVLAAYYTDLQAAPFSAEQYFAPQVELFIILRNTTPAAINAWLSQNRFSEFKDAQTQVEPGTLRVSPVTNDGSRTATYIERSRAFRQSLQKNQYTRAQMRLRLNADYKIVYQKQERLLENTLTDVETAVPQSVE